MTHARLAILRRKVFPLLCTLVIAGAVSNIALADTLKVAVASNFSSTLKPIARAFEQDTGHTVLISSGSSGKHYAQIKVGAPFDVFLSADQSRPRMLLKEGFADFGNAQSYAIGQLVLWSNDSSLAPLSLDTLRLNKVEHIATANPVFAPYGLAAQQVLQASGLFDEIKEKLVRGENIGQAFQYVASANAQVGLVARSQLIQYRKGSSWKIPQSLYDPIYQDAMVLNNKAVAREFMDFLLGEDAQQIIRESGYKSP